VFLADFESINVLIGTLWVFFVSFLCRRQSKIVLFFLLSDRYQVPQMSDIRYRVPGFKTMVRQNFQRWLEKTVEIYFCDYSTVPGLATEG